MNEPNFAQIIDSLEIDKEKVIQFFFVFSRFEYALKRASYVSGGVGSKVSPNWDTFAKEIDATFWPAMTPELETAVAYLQEHPPMKQIVKDSNHSIGWEKTNYDKEGLRGLLLMVRTVRNNLFHGGKYPELPKQDESRDTKLLESCLAILQACLPLHEEVRMHFFEKLG